MGGGGLRERGEELAAWERGERLLVTAIAAHSVGVGLFLALAPGAAAAFAGFREVTPVFFARQAGAFHLVLATGYIAEHLRTRGISLLLIAKGTAVLFLGGCLLFGGLPWSVPFSAALDGFMALAALLVHRRAEAERRRRLLGLDGRQPKSRASGG